LIAFGLALEAVVAATAVPRPAQAETTMTPLDDQGRVRSANMDPGCAGLVCSGEDEFTPWVAGAVM
jgi:hypothetical protein